jgi:16S rRNA (cytosine967-C5)-methyltransferase
VSAVERDPARIPRLRENLTRWGLTAEVVRADATIWRPDRRFDAVLLDAPCSATGTIRRHPDVARLKRPQDLATLTNAQDALLANALALLKPGGRLVYSVCSLQPEEGAPRLAAASASGLARVEPFGADMSGVPETALTAEGFVRTHPALWPDWGGMDGFFIGRLLRV